MAAAADVKEPEGKEEGEDEEKEGELEAPAARSDDEDADEGCCLASLCVLARKHLSPWGQPSGKASFAQGCVQCGVV